jgi:hypothetical protein
VTKETHDVALAVHDAGHDIVDQRGQEKLTLTPRLETHEGDVQVVACIGRYNRWVVL